MPKIAASLRGAKPKRNAKPVADIGVEYQCPICLGVFASLDRHHVVPQATAATSLKEEQGEGPTIDLCASCHRAIHNQALSQFRQTGKIYLTDSQFRRAKRLIDIIVVCLTRDEARGASSAQRKKVTVLFTASELALIDAFKTDTRQNRPDAIRQLIALGLKALKTPLTQAEKPAIRAKKPRSQPKRGKYGNIS